MTGMETVSSQEARGVAGCGGGETALAAVDGAAESGGRVELDACAGASEGRKTRLAGGTEAAVTQDA